MTLNKQKGNMYGFVTHTWNPIRGKCYHNCTYCYMKEFDVGELRLDEKVLRDNLGSGRYIFVGSSTDMFAEKVPNEWIEKVMKRCNEYPENTYLFQTKNPKGFLQYKACPYAFPPQCIYGTTIETNRAINDRNRNRISMAPAPSERAGIISVWARRMVSIEPILDFDLETMVEWMKKIDPEFISIGADSKNHNLFEPSPDKVMALITMLRKFTVVRLKDNLARIIGRKEFDEMTCELRKICCNCMHYSEEGGMGHCLRDGALRMIGETCNNFGYENIRAEAMNK